MTMNSALTVVRPKGTVINRKGGVRYVYAVKERVYDPATKNTLYKGRTCIGKMQGEQGDRMVPNEKYRLLFSELFDSSLILPPPPSFSATLNVGALALLRSIADSCGLTDVLVDIYGRESALDILDITGYILTEESAAFQHYPSFARETLLNRAHILRDSDISRMLQETIDNDNIENFKKKWNKRHCGDETVYISVDSTNFNTEAEAIAFGEFGAAKDDETKPQVNMQVSLKDDGTPLNYELYPGSIVDMSECDRMLEQMHDYGFNNIGLMFDRGYFTEAVIKEIDKKKFHAVMMANEMHGTVADLVRANAARIADGYELCLPDKGMYGLTVKNKFHGKERFFHIYFDSIKASRLRHGFDMRMQGMRKRLDQLVGTVLRKNVNLAAEKKWFKLEMDKKTGVLNGYKEKPLSKKNPSISKLKDTRNRYGFFVIMTTEEMTAERALYLYRSRDSIEKFFRGIKSGMDFDTPGIEEDETLAGKVHLVFLTAIQQAGLLKISRKLKNSTGNKKDFTVPGIMRIMRSLECTLAGNDSGTYKRHFALTAGQKMVMEKAGIDEDYIDKRIAEFKTSNTKNTA